jgi:hypothetical protein
MFPEVKFSIVMFTPRPPMWSFFLMFPTKMFHVHAGHAILSSLRRHTNSDGGRVQDFFLNNISWLLQDEWKYFIF